MPDDRTIVTELGTALGTLPYADRRVRPWPRPGQLRVDRRIWDHLDAVHRVRPLRVRAGHGLRQRPGPAGGGRRAARPYPAHHRVDRRAAASRATRWPPSTCGSTTSTWSAASTSRTSWPTPPPAGSSTACWPPRDRGTGATGTRRSPPTSCAALYRAVPGGDRADRLPPDAFGVQSGAARDACAGPSPVAPTPTPPRGRLRRAVPDGQRGVGPAVVRDGGGIGRRARGHAVAAAPDRQRPLLRPGQRPADRRAGPLPDRQPVGLAGRLRAGGVRRRPRRRPASRGSTGRARYRTARGRHGRPRSAGHVEIRWSHGRFAQPPEAKVYLDTPMADLPGYHPLAPDDRPSPPCGPSRMSRPMPRPGTATATSSGSTTWPPPASTCTGRPSSSCAGSPPLCSTPDAGPAGWPGSWPAAVSTWSGVDADPSMIATARRLAPELHLGGGRPSRARPRAPVRRWWSWPATSRCSRRQGPRPRWWPACARHVADGGHLVAGFQLDRGYDLARYDEHCRAGRAGPRGPVGHLVG